MSSFGIFQEAQKQAASLHFAPAQVPAAVEALRAETFRLGAITPLPPLYRRAEDPTRKQAQLLLPDAVRALAHGLALVRVAERNADLERLLTLLHAQVEVLHHTAEGRLEEAEEAWHRARRQHPTQKILGLSRDRPPAYDPSSGRSRYDPAPTPTAQAKLTCPNTGCKRMDDYGFVSTYATHRFRCAHCEQPFLAYFGELQSLEVRAKGSARTFFFVIQELGAGQRTRVEFEEASGEAFAAAPRDLLVFLYTEERILKSVMNLSQPRTLWLSPASRCFLVTVSFGEGAPELSAFRAFRDERLNKSAWGRQLIRGYYWAGPHLARWVALQPRVKRLLRSVLLEVHRALTKRGFT